MNDQDTDYERRKYIILSSMLGGLGLGFAIVPFAASWLPSARAKAIGAPIDVDISKIEDGQKMTIDWRGQPIFIIKRDSKSINNLLNLSDKLKDPDSKEKQQPVYINSVNRSIKPEIFVVIGICTHLGCVPLYKPKVGEVDDTWIGGFFCPCHGSRFDLAGRVFKGVPAPCNLIIPPHKYIDNHILRIGED